MTQMIFILKYVIFIYVFVFQTVEQSQLVSSTYKFI